MAGRHHGHRRAARAHPQGAQVPAGVGHLARRHPRRRAGARRRAGRRVDCRRAHAHGLGHAGELPAEAIRTARSLTAGSWETPTSCAAWPRAPSRPTPTPGSATSPPTSSGPWPPSSASSALEVRVTNRQNVVFRGLTEEQLPTLYARLDAIGMAEPGAELARDVVACPGADTCNLAVTQSRGLADAIGTALDEAGLADVGGVRINISGLHQLVRPAPHRRHRVHRRRAPGPRPVGPGLPDAARRPRRPDGDRVRRQGPAAAGQGAGEATVRVVGRFAASARRARRSASGSTASAGRRRWPPT